MIDSPLRCNSATANGRNSPTVHGYTINQNIFDLISMNYINKSVHGYTIKQNIFDLINMNYIKKSHSVWIKEYHRINEIKP